MSLYRNINRRKKLGISRKKKDSTISKKNYDNMKKGFPKKAQMAKKKNNLLNESTHETRAKFKKTTIGRRPSSAMMNKKKTFKKYVGQGK